MTDQENKIIVGEEQNKCQFEDVNKKKLLKI